MEFEYFYTQQATGSLDIEDIGNCAIQANTDNGVYFYLVIETHLGFSHIFRYGPRILNSDSLPKSCSCSYSCMEYNEGKLQTAIQQFLNPKFYQITQAIEIDKDTALNNCISILDYFKDSKNLE